MKFTITAVIPTSQYANIQPSIEVEADTFEEAYEKAMPHIEKISLRYAEPGKALQPKFTTTAQAPAAIKVGAFVGGSINYDDVSHTYTNDNGEVYMSGSVYAKQFEKPFNGEMIAGKMADSSGVPAADILDAWDMKATASASFGTAIHEAMELYAKHRELCEKLGKEYHISSIPVIAEIVQSFFSQHQGELAVEEAMVVDHDKKRAGQIDRLLITGDKRCRVQDYKTNGEMKKEKLENYWHQLSFYAAILQAHGWTVEGLDIFHLQGTVWKTHSSEVKEVK